jgi:hypothetical protein
MDAVSLWKRRTHTCCPSAGGLQNRSRQPAPAATGCGHAPAAPCRTLQCVRLVQGVTHWHPLPTVETARPAATSNMPK